MKTRLLLLSLWLSFGTAWGDLLSFSPDRQSLLFIEEETLNLRQQLPLQGKGCDGPVFSPDGKNAYVLSCSGEVQRLDLKRGKVSARAHLGSPSHALALSGDGRYLAVAGDTGLFILDAVRLSLLKSVPSGKILQIQAAPLRQSFLLRFEQLAELWEVLLEDDPLPVYNGPMHDYRMDEGIARETGRFPARRISLDAPLRALLLTPDNRMILGRMGEDPAVQLIHLDVRRSIGTLPLEPALELGRGAFWRSGRLLLGLPHGEEPLIRVFDFDEKKLLRQIPAPAAGCKLYSGASALWIGGCGEQVRILDPNTLEPLKTLRPAPGQSITGIQFAPGDRVILHLAAGLPVIVQGKTLQVRQVR